MAQKFKYLLLINKDLSHEMLVVPIAKVADVIKKTGDVDMVFIGRNKKSIEEIFRAVVAKKELELNGLSGI